MSLFWPLLSFCLPDQFNGERGRRCPLVALGSETFLKVLFPGIARRKTRIRDCCLKETDPCVPNWVSNLVSSSRLERIPRRKDTPSSFFWGNTCAVPPSGGLCVAGNFWNNTTDPPAGRPIRCRSLPFGWPSAAKHLLPFSLAFCVSLVCVVVVISSLRIWVACPGTVGRGRKRKQEEEMVVGGALPSLLEGL